MHVCMCVCMYACVYVCMYVWMDGWMDVCIQTYISILQLHIYVVCMYTNVYSYIAYPIQVPEITEGKPLRQLHLAGAPGAI